jgi:hypothetical protein
MSEIRPHVNDWPQISFRQGSPARAAGPDLWRMMWHIENMGRRPLTLSAARFPHGRFKAAEQRFEPPIDLGPDERSEIETLTVCHEPPGAVVENAFVILTVIWLGTLWRIFGRLRITIDSHGQPDALTEFITAQRAGFSQEFCGMDKQLIPEGGTDGA